MNEQTDNFQTGTLLHQLLYIGEAMLASGGEVNRVEDTLIRLGRAYGAVEMNVFVITSSIVITMVMQDGRETTQTRRVLSTGSTDFARLEALNALSRRCCADPISVEELAEQVRRIRELKPSRLHLYAGSLLAVGSFTLFFGGSVWDMAASMVFALVVCLLQERLAPLCETRMIFNLLTSLLVGMGICAAAKLCPLLRVDAIMIGDIMLLIPGLAMTNSVRDILMGDTIAGVMRLIESLLWAGALAIGFVLSIWLMTGGR